MGAEIFDYAVTIRESHLDTFGHVNNAAYLQLFEEARWEVVSARGFSLKEVQEKKLGPTLLEVKIQWKREIRLREKITIRTQMTSQHGKVQHLRQAMVNANGEEACVAEFVIALFDLKARKLVEPTAEWKHAIGAE